MFPSELDPGQTQGRMEDRRDCHVPLCGLQPRPMLGREGVPMGPLGLTEVPKYARPCPGQGLGPRQIITGSGEV